MGVLRLLKNMRRFISAVPKFSKSLQFRLTPAASSLYLRRNYRVTPVAFVIEPLIPPNKEEVDILLKKITEAGDKGDMDTVRSYTEELRGDIEEKVYDLQQPYIVHVLMKAYAKNNNYPVVQIYFDELRLAMDDPPPIELYHTLLQACPDKATAELQMLMMEQDGVPPTEMTKKIVGNKK